MSLLAVEGWSKSFGRVEVFADVSFSISSGEVVALVGDNGCGKTTLIRCIARLDAFDTGIEDSKARAQHVVNGRDRRGFVGCPAFKV